MKCFFISIPYDNTAIDVGEIRNLKVDIKKSIRSRGISIKINYMKNSITLTHSVLISEKQAIDFLKSKYNWIYVKFAQKNVIEENHTDFKIENGKDISICGSVYIVEHCKAEKGIFIKDNKLIVSGEIEFLPRRVRDFAKKMLINYIKIYVNKFPDFKKRITKIHIKDTISRWGSCSSNGNLSFSYRIAFAPQFVIDYVIAHELCHLKEMNHSKNFWKLVYEISPFPITNRAIKWLNRNGFLLHKI